MKKTKQDKQQQITTYGIRHYEEDKGLGSWIMESKNGMDLRVFLQNPDRVMAADKELDDRRSMLSLKEWDADVIALPETNINWQKEWIRNKCKGILYEY